MNGDVLFVLILMAGLGHLSTICVTAAAKTHGVEALGFWLAAVAVAAYFVATLTIMVRFREPSHR